MPWSARFLDADADLSAHVAVAAAVHGHEEGAFGTPSFSLPRGPRRCVRRARGNAPMLFLFLWPRPGILGVVRPRVLRASFRVRARPSIHQTAAAVGQWESESVRSLVARVRPSPAMGAASQPTPRRQIEQSTGARVLHQTRRRRRIRFAASKLTADSTSRAARDGVKRKRVPMHVVARGFPAHGSDGRARTVGG